MPDPVLNAQNKVQKQSSPRYPFISLTKALDRAEQLRQAAGANAAFVTDARAAWGYGPKSSGGDQTIAALSYYGLIEDMGSGPARKLKLSEPALRYFRDERPEVRDQLLARFALSPKIMTKLWEMWKHAPPSDSVARSILKVDLNYSDYAAKELLEVYKQNLHYIPVDKASSVDSAPTEPQEEKQQGDRPTEKPIGISDPLTERIANHFSRTPPTPTKVSTHSGQTDELRVLLEGKRLKITADVDRAGLQRLKEILTRYEGILELMDLSNQT